MERSRSQLLPLGLLLSRREAHAMARLPSDLQEVFGKGMVQADRCRHHSEVAPAAERRSISLLDVEARLRQQQAQAVWQVACPRGRRHPRPQLSVMAANTTPHMVSE